MAIFGVIGILTCLWMPLCPQNKELSSSYLKLHVNYVRANYCDSQRSADGQDDRVVYGVSAMQGWRISMEDAHAAVLDLQVEDSTKDFQAASAEDRLSFFGVYDGHGGDKVASYAGENVHKILAKQEAFRKGDFEQALKDGFLATDRAILNGKAP